MKISLNKETFSSIQCTGYYKPCIMSFGATEPQWWVNDPRDFRLCVKAQSVESVDSGAFQINGYQVKLIIVEMEINLVVDATSHWANSQQWWENYSPALKTRGQVFVWDDQAKNWQDVAEMSCQAEIQARYDARRAAASVAWKRHYDILRGVGISGPEARKMNSTMSFDDVEEFGVLIPLLRHRKFGPKRLKRALKYGAKSHIYNVLGIHVSRYAGAEAAILRYLAEISE